MWQKNKKLSGYIGLFIIAVLVTLVVFLVIRASVVNGSGLDATTTVTVSQTTTPPTTVTTKQYQPGKTLWDWMQLLIIPAMLVIGGFWLNQIQKSRDEKATEERTEAERKFAEEHARIEREFADDNRCEAALQAYIDNMSKLLLEKSLRKSQPKDEVRTIARALTLTVLPRLDSKRKRNLLLFLFDADLVDRGGRIVDISDADLSGVDLSDVHLWRTKLVHDNQLQQERFEPVSADLSGVSLQNANLNGADLSDVKLGAKSVLDLEISLKLTGKGVANLSKAQLVGANLRNAPMRGVNLSGANLSNATLSGACLQRANLNGATLHGADLSIQPFIEDLDNPGEETQDTSEWIGADLSDAELRETNLSGANLWQANLSGADLRGADLSGADLRGAVGTTDKQLEQVKSLKGATMPNGSKHL